MHFSRAGKSSPSVSHGPNVWALFYGIAHFMYYEKINLLRPHFHAVTAQAHWNLQAKLELNKARKLKPNIHVAKNVILFLGDGMGVSTVTAARILKGQLQNKSGEEGLLSFEEFPNVGLSKVCCRDKVNCELRVKIASCELKTAYCELKL